MHGDLACMQYSAKQNTIWAGIAIFPEIVMIDKFLRITVRQRLGR